MIVARFVNFIELVAAKIGYFVEENVQRSLNYSHKISNYAKDSSSMEVRQCNHHPGLLNQLRDGMEPTQFERERETGMKYEKNRYRSTMPTAFT